MYTAKLLINSFAYSMDMSVCYRPLIPGTFIHISLVQDQVRGYHGC